jgi:predicted Zn-dependent peptidase
MTRLLRLLAFSSALAVASAAGVAQPALAAPSPAAPPPLPDIPFTKVVLKNGLTLIVHEDHKAPVVAVMLWYHVGSKDEPPGRTGFAHLFEHLMFGSTGGNQRGWFERLEGVGATGVNGTTEYDRTNFFETVPTPALDMTLAMEAGRMGHLLDSFTEALLTTQRGVVQNEKRQDENQPYAVSDEIITKSVWPASHPYSHTVIGEMADLDAAKVEDVKDWFAKYYGPSNAVLVMAGDITPAEAQAKAEKYFGAIPPGPPVVHQKAWIAKRTGEQRAAVQDRVPQARLYLEWNVPPEGSADADRLDLIADVLATGKDSRLYRRLVYQDQIATDVSAENQSYEIAGLFDVELTAKPGVPLSRLEAAFREELDRLLKEGPTEAEIARFKSRRIANFVRRAERVGGFGGKSDILAQAETYLGDAGAWKARLERIRQATPAEVGDAGRRWLSDGAFVLELTPFPDFAPVPGATANAVPQPSAPLAPHFPAVRTAALSNGLKVVVAERHETPMVTFYLVVDAGAASDPAGQNGVSALDTAAVLDGTATLDALAFNDREIELGVAFGTGSSSDASQVFMSALSSRLDPSLDLMADVVLRPAYRPADVAREKALMIANIQQQSQDPISEAFRITPTLVYGADHPYGRLLTEADVARLTPEDLKRHHDAWFRPEGATLVVVGDTTLEQVQPKLEARFGAWRGTGPAPAKSVAPPAPPAGGVVYLIDKPGALQTVISAVTTAPPRRDPDDVAIRAMMTTLGGAFTSRLNMNLREDKHWAYGAFAFVDPARAGGLFMAIAPVQTDKTKESFVEMQKELNDVIGAKPVTAHELELSQHNLTLSLPGRWETGQSVAGSLGEIATFGLPADYYETYARRVGDLTLADIQRAAGRVVRPGQMVWIVVGDKTKILAPLQSLGLNIRVIGADGQPLP